MHNRTQRCGAKPAAVPEIHRRMVRGRNAAFLKTGEQLQAEIAYCKRTEELLRESESRYWHLMENARDVIFALTADGTITSLNAAFEHATGWTRAEWIGRSYKDLVHPEDQSRAARLLRRVRRDAAPAEFELRIRTRSGEPRLGEFKISRERRPPHLILGIVRDITERVKADEERARLAAAVEATAEAVVVTDHQGHIQYVNPAFEQITGYSRTETIGRTVHLLDSGKHDEAFFRGVREALRRDGVWRGRLIQKKKDGTLYFEDCSCSPVKDREGRIINYVSVKRDVTDRLRLESIAESVNGMEGIGYVFSGVRHEIGNPVNSAKMILNVLRDKLGTCTEEKTRDYVDRALNEIGRVEYILKGFRNCSLYEEPEIGSVDLTGFLDRFRSLVSEDFGRKRITLTVDAGRGPVAAAADARLLQQALLNIMTNAADALAGREDPAISLAVRTDGGRVFISVGDNGCGMTAEQQQQLFKPFHTTKPHGTGLGLILVRKMLRRMSGDVTVASEPGRGTTVVLSLPGGNGDAVAHAGDRQTVTSAPAAPVLLARSASSAANSP